MVLDERRKVLLLQLRFFIALEILEELIERISFLFFVSDLFEFLNGLLFVLFEKLRHKCDVLHAHELRFLFIWQNIVVIFLRTILVVKLTLVVDLLSHQEVSKVFERDKAILYGAI